jgi:hypothetical protein
MEKSIKIVECCPYCGIKGHSLINCPSQQSGAALATGILGG